MVKMGFIIKYYRGVENLTQRQLSQKAKISVSHLSKIESNKKVPSIRVLLNLCIALKIKNTNLFFED